MSQLAQMQELLITCRGLRHVIMQSKMPTSTNTVMNSRRRQSHGIRVWHNMHTFNVLQCIMHDSVFQKAV